MKTYISILRGINVSGQKIIKMERLRKMYEDLGFKNVKTYIQSGNVLFDFKEEKDEKLVKIIHAGIEKTFGFDVPVMVRSADEIKKIAENNPFVNERNLDVSYLHVTFLAAKPQGDLFDKIDKNTFLPDEMYLFGNVLYIYTPNGYGNSKINTNFFENKLKVTATTRNWKTTLTLLEMSGS